MGGGQHFSHTGGGVNFNTGGERTFKLEEEGGYDGVVEVEEGRM